MATAELHSYHAACVASQGAFALGREEAQLAACDVLKTPWEVWQEGAQEREEAPRSLWRRLFQRSPWAAPWRTLVMCSAALAGLAYWVVRYVETAAKHDQTIGAG